MAWKASVANILSLPGRFRRPPLLSQGMMYAVDVSGALCASSLDAGAERQEIAMLEPGAAFNTAVLLPVLRLGAAYPEVTFAGVSRAAVQAVTVATGEVRTVYQPKANRTLAVNEAGAASGFGGVAATASACAVAERVNEGQIALVLQSFSPGQPSEQPFLLDGNAVAGPTLHDGVIALCTREQTGVFDTVSGKTASMALPRRFEPYMARRQGAIVLAPGTIPLAGVRWAEGLCAVIAGEQGGVPGVLTVSFARQTSRFEPLGTGSSITVSAEGILAIAEGDDSCLVNQTYRIGTRKHSKSRETGLHRTKYSLRCSFCNPRALSTSVM